MDLGKLLSKCGKQQAHLMSCKVGDRLKNLSAARCNIHKLVGMHTAAANERGAQALEVGELRWRVSDLLSK